MKAKYVCVAAVLVVLFVGQVRAQVVGETKITMTVPRKQATGVGITILADGKLSLDSTEKVFMGISFHVIDPNQNKIQGFVNLPNGPPALGGPPKDWTGNVPASAREVFTCASSRCST